MAQKLKKRALAICILLAILVPAFPVIVNAACAPGETCGGQGNEVINSPDASSTSGQSICSSPENLTVAQQKSCQHCNNTTNNDALKDCLHNNVIVGDLQNIVNFLSALVGIVVTGAIILGGIQYSLAGGSPDAVTKAKQRITNGLIALVGFIFIFAFLQWLIPGGIFG